MSIQKYIKDNIDRLGKHTYKAPEIPDHRLNGAISSHGADININYIVALKDTSILSTGKEGCLFLGDVFYLKAPLTKSIKIEYALIDTIRHSTEAIRTRLGNPKVVEKVNIFMQDGSTIDVSDHLFGIDKQLFVTFIQGILAEAKSGRTYHNSSQVTPLSEMSEKIKLIYLKLVANFTYSNHDVIDVHDYIEMISLISRIELDTVHRLQVREYLSDIELIEMNDDLLQDLKMEVGEGSFDIVSQSLFKDVLYIFGKKQDLNTWRDNTFLHQLFLSLPITTEEIDVMLMAIRQDEDILTYRKNDSQIKKSMIDLSAKATAVGLPMAAIYLSGSVVGLSAAGMTSGLASIGLGGLFGFSSMFTGIGVAVMVGIGTYQGIKKFSGMKELENNKQRELMLQAMIRNAQKSLNYLVEDIQAITERLVSELNKENHDIEKAQHLSYILSMLSEGAKINAEKETYSQIEQVITMLPPVLDVDRLHELTNKPTLKKVRQFVESCYVQVPRLVVKNKITTTKAKYELKEGLSLKEVEDLHKCLEQIDYNKVAQAAMASASAKAKSLFKNR